MYDNLRALPGALDLKPLDSVLTPLLRSFAKSRVTQNVKFWVARLFLSLMAREAVQENSDGGIVFLTSAHARVLAHMTSTTRGTALTLFSKRKVTNDRK